MLHIMNLMTTIIKVTANRKRKIAWDRKSSADRRSGRAELVLGLEVVIREAAAL
jgi:hypothetical protein